MTQMNAQPRRRKVAIAAAMALLFPAIAGNAIAQNAPTTPYPTRPVTIVVPFAPGGGSDIVARLLGVELSKKWKTSVIIQNKPGAGGQIGNAEVARAKGDDHILLLGNTTLIQAPSLYKNLPYDVFKDFTPLAQIATSVNYLVVPASSPAKSVKEFVAIAKSKQGGFNYGSNGTAGTSHLHGALFNTYGQLGMEHVGYAGSGPLLTALLGQQIECGFVDIAPLRAFLTAGKLRALAGTGTKRSAALPDIPTLSEVGIQGFEPVGWFALLGPAGISDAVKKTISDSVVEVLRDPKVSKTIEDLGLTLAPLPAEEFAKVMKEDKPKWENMIKTGNVKVD